MDPVISFVSGLKTQLKSSYSNFTNYLIFLDLSPELQIQKEIAIREVIDSLRHWNPTYVLFDP